MIKLPIRNELLDTHPDIGGNLPKQRGRNVSPLMKRDGGYTTVGVLELLV
jgi:hypothetical protein